MKTVKTIRFSFILFSTIILVMMYPNQAVKGQTIEGVFPASGSPAKPKVEASWNHYYTYEGITELTKLMTEAYPNLIRRQSIGKSVQGRDIWLLTITNFKKGEADQKPAMYIDGNIHSNEIQGTEVALYTAWYLSEMFDEVEFIHTLLDNKTFYIVPTINPDARQDFMKEPNTANSPRSGMKPIDDDGDGLVDEDGFDDLNGDGSITMMRRKDDRGSFRIDPEFSNRMVRVGIDEFGSYELLGREGLDNDGDGRINEDRAGYYDPNRDWGWNWQPNYIQGGAYKYPFSLPENRAIMEFVMAHPNIAGAQSYHNSGGMILRGPGAKEDRDTYNRIDERVYDAIGKVGEKLLPGYDYMVVYRDLYTVFGGELDWFYGSRGVFTFSNELWTGYEMFQDENGGRSQRYAFNKYLLFGDAFVDWETYEHPVYGTVEIGGFKKNFGRAHPGFLLEQDAHRNMAFTIYHAYQMPHLVIGEITEKDLGDGLAQVTAVITNTRIIPTHSGQDLRYNIERPDYITLQGADVLAGMIVKNRDMNVTAEQQNKPERIEVDNIPGMSAVVVRWIVESGASGYTIKVDSEKGGIVTKSKD